MSKYHSNDYSIEPSFDLNETETIENQNNGNNSKKNLGTGAIIGIVISCVVLVLIIVSIVFIFRRKKSTKSVDDGLYHDCP